MSQSNDNIAHERRSDRRMEIPPLIRVPVQMLAVRTAFYDSNISIDLDRYGAVT